MSQDEMIRNAANVGAPPGAPESDDDRLDAATASISEALRTSFLALKVVLVVLIFLYLGSGYFTVTPGSQAVVVQLGRIRGLDADPILKEGAHWAWPWPVSTVIPENTEQIRALQLQTFWFWMPSNMQGWPLDKLQQHASPQLHPARDGYLLTGDQEIVHLQLEIRYRVDNLVDYITHVDDAPRLLRTIGEWATLQTVGRMPTDEVVRGGAGEQAPQTQPAAAQLPPAAEPNHAHEHAGTDLANENAEARSAHAASSGVHGAAELRDGIRRRMQERLDALRAGISVVDVIPRERTVPLQVRPAYLQVVQAENQTQSIMSEARKKAAQVLLETAGPAYVDLRDAIREYEMARDLGEKDQAEKAFQHVLTLLDPDQVGGEVAVALSDAEAYRTRVIQKVNAQVDRFQELYGKYRENPRIFLSRLWEETKQKILASPEIEVFFLPAGGKEREIRLTIERNPQYLRARELQKYTKQVQGG